MRSMTGFGKARGGNDQRYVEVEVRSVNNRFLKVQIRLPRELSGCDNDIEKLVRKEIGRGAVHLSLRLCDDTDASGVRIDDVVAERLYREANELAQGLGLSQSPSLSDILSLPGVVVSTESNDEAATDLRELALNTVREAIDALKTMRATEGEILARELVVIRQRIGENLAFVESRVPEVTGEVREKLRRRLEQLLTDAPRDVKLDDAILHREVAVLADRSDVAEEIQRLHSHLSQFDTLMGAEEVGRKLEFLLQEMLREVNTIASKASDAAVAHRVVDMKSDLERLREQAQNVE